MGKDSLIKSTSKKKAGTKKGKTKTAKKPAAQSAPAKKKAAQKPAAKTTKKTAPKKTAPIKAALNSTQKATAANAASAKTKPAPKKPAPPKPVKTLTVKELIFQKFEPLQPDAPLVPAPERTVMPASAPPIVSSSNPDEAKRLHELLLRQFSMAEVKAAAKEPQPVPESKAAEKASEPEPVVKPPTAASEPAAQSPAAAEPAKTKPAEDSAYITMETAEEKPASDPVTRAAKIGVAVAAVVVFLLLSISYNNSAKYYIYPKENAIEIWKGRFSPKDTMFYMVLHGVELDEPAAAVYSSAEVFPLIFGYYLDKADTLLEVPGLPDFEGIKGYLHQAEAYVVTGDMKTAVTSRLNNIERMTLLYKAEVAISRGTVDSLQSGIKLLKDADAIAASDIQSQEILQKIEAAREQIAALEAASK